MLPGSRALSSATPSGPLLPLLTFAMCNGMALPALPSLLMRRVPSGAPIFPLQLGTLYFLTSCQPQLRLSTPTFSTHSLSASRLSHPCTNLVDLVPLLTTNSLLRSPSATSLGPVWTASHTHSSKSHSHGGVIFCFPSSTSFLRLAVLPSAWKSSLVVPVPSAMVTPPPLIPVVLFLSRLALSNCSHYAPQSPTTRHFPGRFPPAWRRYGLQPCGLRLRRHEHTSVAFIDIKKAFDFCWVEATLVRLFDFGVMGRLWHLLANFLCGTLSQVRLGGSVSSPWVDSGIAQGRVLSPLLFNLLIDSLAVALRSTIPGVSLAASDQALVPW